MIEPLEINGQPPALAGRVCDELLCRQYWYRGELYNPVAVLFLRSGNIWHRLYFDFGIIFWRADQSRPESFEVPEFEWSYRLVDIGIVLGLQGRQLHRYEMTSIKGGSQVEFFFVGDRSVVLKNVDDRTSLTAN
jgi:hypothetical protein